MIAQFLPGFPGARIEESRIYIDTGAADFEEQVLRFYEDYLSVFEGALDIEASRFILTPDVAGGFFALLKNLPGLSEKPIAVKGQITGPITFTTGLKDQSGRAVFYDAQLQDAAVKLLAAKARWQVRRLSKFGCPVIVFFDEPALAGFGSSEFISITREQIMACLNEVFEAVRQEGGLAGIHVCANTDWSMILESRVDIVNFDAYSFFDRFILYPRQLVEFFKSGRILAWGVVPTLHAADIEKETVSSLAACWEEKVCGLEALGIPRPTIVEQSLITPSCGAGSLSVDHALKVLELTRGLSETLRKR
jgi:methionine synthase II (cobalamin-independent)